MVADFLKILLVLTFFVKTKLVAQTPKDSINIEQLNEVVVKNKVDNINEVNPDKIYLSNKSLKESIHVLGEANPIKLLQLSSGVQAGAEGQSGLIVRGGNQSMNATYIDGIYLHNASHIGGLFPVLNGDYIKNISFYKGGFKAEDGGRLSSINKVNTKSSLEDHHFKLNVGLLATKLSSSFNLHKLNTKVFISGRRTFLEFFDAITGKENTVLGEGRNYFFYDYLVKVETKINSKNSITFTHFNSKDNYKNMLDETQLNWQNNLVGFNWDYHFSRNFKNQFTVSNSNFKLNNEFVNFPIDYSFTSTYNVLDFKNVSKIICNNHTTSFGFQFQKTENLPRKLIFFDADNTEISREINNNTYLTYDSSLFIDDVWALSKKLKLHTGLRFTSYYLSNDSSYSDSFIEPRLSANYELNDVSALKFSFQSLKQSVHQARIATLSLPLDYYVPTNKDLPFQESIQFSSGYFFNKSYINGNIGLYYKNVNHYTEFKNGSVSNLYNPNLYNDIVVGTLNSFGLETHFEIEINKLKAVLNYTFSRSNATFKEINQGESFPIVFNRPYNFNLSLNYKLHKKWRFSSLFIFTSGQNYTPIQDIRIVNEFPVLNFGIKNSARFSNYHRLDIGVDYIIKQSKHFESEINLSVYNVYNNSNTFYINNQITENTTSHGFFISSSEENLFPILPSVSWSLKF